MNDLETEKLWHKDFLHRPFMPSISLERLDPETREILEKYGAWLDALARKVIDPLTEEQSRFVTTVNGDFTPNTKYEIAYKKYIDLVEIIEKEQSIIRKRYYKNLNKTDDEKSDSELEEESKSRGHEEVPECYNLSESSRPYDAQRALDDKESLLAELDDKSLYGEVAGIIVKVK